MKPFVVARSGTLYAVYATDRQSAVQAVGEGADSAEPADGDTLELFRDEFDEASQTREPVELETQ